MVASRTRRALLLGAATVGAALGFAAWRHLDARRHDPPEIGGYLLAAPRALPDVELVDEDGAALRPADFVGHWSLLYFGYTYCPDVCPLTLVELAKVKRLLDAASTPERVEYYLVSVDPQRDTPQRLREYVAYFDPQFRGVTGSPRALTELAAAAEALFDVPQGQDGDNYLVSHSSNVVLLDPGGRVHAVLTPPHDPGALAADFTKIAARYAARR